MITLDFVHKDPQKTANCAVLKKCFIKKKKFCHHFPYAVTNLFEFPYAEHKMIKFNEYPAEWLEGYSDSF